MEDANHNVALIFHLHQGVVNMMEVMMGHGSSRDVANRRDLVESELSQGAGVPTLRQRTLRR
jgi:hypothetical protein